MNTTEKNRLFSSLPKITIIVLGVILSMACKEPLNARSSKDRNTKNVRIMRNEDGSFTEFRRSSDDRVIERRTYGNRHGGAGDRVLRMTVIYRKDKNSKLRSGKIHDGSGKVLYRVVYGYHRVTGKLVAEDMFDARVKRGDTVIDPATNQAVFKEKPVRCLRHRYDALGRQLKPVVYCAPAGKKAEDLFGKDGSSYIEDPWAKDAGSTANPNSRPVGR